MISEERIEELADTSNHDLIAFARAIEREAHCAGQERMRERAAERLESEHNWISREAASYLIRNLEVEEPR